MHFFYNVLGLGGRGWVQSGIEDTRRSIDYGCRDPFFRMLYGGGFGRGIFLVFVGEPPALECLIPFWNAFAEEAEHFERAIVVWKDLGGLDWRERHYAVGDYHNLILKSGKVGVVFANSHAGHDYAPAHSLHYRANVVTQVTFDDPFRLNLRLTHIKDRYGKGYRTGVLNLAYPNG